ncbi:hypothetical protein CHUAL_008810 [Chamberlinius hualienensis]
MSSAANTIRGIRRKKSSLSEVKIAVLGASGVGKTALTVRFLTKRYIGEYDHQIECRYKSEVLVDNEPVIFEDGVEMPRDDVVQWADGFLLIYSITDRASFNLLKVLRQHIYENKQVPKDTSGQNTPPQFPMVVVANKSDLIHLRQVSTEEGEILSKDMDSVFTELSAAEHVAQVSEAFYDLCREVHAVRRRTKQSLLDRMLGKK